MSYKLAILSNPRSGTSLLTHLVLGSFDIINSSLYRPVFDNYDEHDIYSYRVLLRDIDTSRLEEYRLISIIRDPRDVVSSIHPSWETYMIDFEKWYSNFIEQEKLFCHPSVCVVWFEDLIRNPRRVENTIGSFLGLSSSVSFYYCYTTYDSLSLGRQKEMEKEMGGARELDPNMVGRWRRPVCKSRVDKQIKKYPWIVSELSYLGYEG